MLLHTRVKGSHTHRMRTYGTGLLSPARSLTINLLSAECLFSSARGARGVEIGAEADLWLVPGQFISTSCSHKQRTGSWPRKLVNAGLVQKNDSVRGWGWGLTPLYKINQNNMTTNFTTYSTTENTDVKPEYQWSTQETHCLCAVWASSEVQSKLEGASWTKLVFEQMEV